MSREMLAAHIRSIGVSRLHLAPRPLEIDGKRLHHGMIFAAHIDRISGRKLLDDLRVRSLHQRAVLLRFAPGESDFKRRIHGRCRFGIRLHPQRVNAAATSGGVRAVHDVFYQRRFASSRRFDSLVMDHVPRLLRLSQIPRFRPVLSSVE